MKSRPNKKGVYYQTLMNNEIIKYNFVFVLFKYLFIYSFSISRYTAIHKL